MINYDGFYGKKKCFPKTSMIRFWKIRLKIIFIWLLRNT